MKIYTVVREDFDEENIDGADIHLYHFTDRNNALEKLNEIKSVEIKEHFGDIDETELIDSDRLCCVGDDFFSLWVSKYTLISRVTVYEEELNFGDIDEDELTNSDLLFCEGDGL